MRDEPEEEDKEDRHDGGCEAVELRANTETERGGQQHQDAAGTAKREVRSRPGGSQVPYVICDESGVLAIYKPPHWTMTTTMEMPRETSIQAWLGDSLGRCYPYLQEDALQAGLIQRLDVETSGPVVVATQPETFQKMWRLRAAGHFYREYLALLHGTLPLRHYCGTLEYSLDTSRRFSKVSERHGLPARTRYQAVAAFSRRTGRGRGEGRGAGGTSGAGDACGGCPRSYTLIRVRILTGRLHQIRVHLRELARRLGLPVCGVVGDYKYLPRAEVMKDREFCPRVFLHARVLRFPLPGKQRTLCHINCELPLDLIRALHALTPIQELTAEYNRGRDFLYHEQCEGLVHLFKTSQSKLPASPSRSRSRSRSRSPSHWRPCSSPASDSSEETTREPSEGASRKLSDFSVETDKVQRSSEAEQEKELAAAPHESLAHSQEQGAVEYRQLQVPVNLPAKDQEILEPESVKPAKQCQERPDPEREDHAGSEAVSANSMLDWVWSTHLEAGITDAVEPVGESSPPRKRRGGPMLGDERCKTSPSPCHWCPPASPPSSARCRSISKHANAPPKKRKHDETQQQSPMAAVETHETKPKKKKKKKKKKAAKCTVSGADGGQELAVQGGAEVLEQVDGSDGAVDPGHAHLLILFGSERTASVPSNEVPVAQVGDEQLLSEAGEATPVVESNDEHMFAEPLKESFMVAPAKEELVAEPHEEELATELGDGRPATEPGGGSLVVDPSNEVAAADPGIEKPVKKKRRRRRSATRTVGAIQCRHMQEDSQHSAAQCKHCCRISRKLAARATLEIFTQQFCAVRSPAGSLC